MDTAPQLLALLCSKIVSKCANLAALDKRTRDHKVGLTLIGIVMPQSFVGFGKGLNEAIHLKVVVQ